MSGRIKCPRYELYTKQDSVILTSAAASLKVGKSLQPNDEFCACMPVDMIIKAMKRPHQSSQIKVTF